MTVLVLSAVFVTAAVVLALAVTALVSVVRNDGYYPRRTSSAPVATPPRSHPADAFEPRPRAA